MERRAKPSGREWVLATLAALAMVGCDPTWATVFENAGDQAALIRVETRPFNGDDDFSTDFVVEPGARIKVGGNGVASVGQVVRISLLDGNCAVVESEPVIGFDEGGVVQLGPDLRLSMSPGGNPTADDEAVTTDKCA